MVMRNRMTPAPTNTPIPDPARHSLTNVLHALHSDEATEESGAWLFARVTSDGVVVRFDRAFDSWPEWYQVHHSDQGPSLEDLAWEMSQRTPDVAAGVGDAAPALLASLLCHAGQRDRRVRQGVPPRRPALGASVAPVQARGALRVRRTAPAHEDRNQPARPGQAPDTCPKRSTSGTSSDGRSPSSCPRFNDPGFANRDHLWVTEQESRADIIDGYERACRHADATIDALPIDAPGFVPWWPQPDVKLFNVMVHVLTETNRHAGHADILREQLDGAVGAGPVATSDDEADWAAHRSRIEKAAREAAHST